MSTARQLIATGFDDVERARRFLASPEFEGIAPERLLEGLALSADPDLAVLSLVRLAEVAPGVLDLVSGPDGGGLFRLLGASEALAEFLIRHPAHTSLLTEPAAGGGGGDDGGAPASSGRVREALLASVDAAGPEGAETAGASGPAAWAALRVAYRAELTRIALADLGAPDPVAAMPGVGRALADLAAAAVHAALAVARTEAAERFGPEDVAGVRLAVIGMGKCGAAELNYISDVDVVYVHAADGCPEERAPEIAAFLASGIARVLGAPGPEPALWEVDANLRPEGKDGALSRTLDSHVAYYSRWAQSWEFQALLKARRIAGDDELGRAYEEAVAPFIWASSERDGFVESVQAMRRRVTDNIPAQEVARQLKLGPGGLRDVEFTVQLLQLVHGRVDESLRVRDTTSAIAALSEAGYIGRSDAAEFDAAYRYLRVLEHRIQLVKLRRTHLMPVKEDALRALARAAEGTGARTERPTADGLTEQWQKTRRAVKSLHERIFYRPLLATAANLSTDEVRLTPEAAEARLRALGYADPRGALRHIEALTSGVRRRAALQRQLLPVLLGWIAEGVDPDAGLLGFRRLSEALGESPWFLGMLRDSRAGAERLCHVLSGSRFITDLLVVSPESAAWLGDDRELQPMPFEQLWKENAAKMKRHPDAEEAMRLIRLNRRRELLRTALADGAGLIDQDRVGEALSDADRAAVLAALRVAEQDEYAERERITDVLVVAMGRQGGREIAYGSDVDAMFVHRPLPGADPQQAQEQAYRIMTRLGQLATQPLKPAVLAEPKLVVDADLRPEGRQGPLVRTLEAYREYYGRWALVWERQALLRARPLAGDDELAADFMALADDVRYQTGITTEEEREVRRIKARVEAERLPRGADPALHVKLGRGGLSDVEWLVQLLQLRHAAEYPELRTTSTRPALRAIAVAGLLPAEDVELLDRAWALATRIRSATMVCTGRASDVVPRSWRDLEAVARWCGYPAGSASRLEEDYRKATRRARQVFERHFYGFEDKA
ncbi:bifunctional [glutamine synthetase] adenylyltransferase/[glutamine synthetase]-adenylyl-L-tyrosine phosphorylase [Zafaria sp. Z1313]|uniref:bifunctional [glutamine synthetase] adenylyltransferase/[glutamine synthetase]-adenylyl-L-tyrosine phosphorylase n=1 Tax=unclassified Zafaria TaxID=2828765 RepID=UPI002E770F0D|nr:bifunctional [glutamine synthetase] adenylyltransferase/[glutamine synthetase]-adenylyl-L-tyrosine phosphorylase [Zafaria sp. J156]MEE1620269.1 bifunctional [glutamine synthetase] adenylyltransferase/[glutamine synthetase]-adenylyl-L-tyrosine phosphorylase [Zafaria sp. J156]